MSTLNQMTLTPRQFQVLKLVDSSRQNRCYSITLQELADLLGTSRTTVFEHIASLKEKGLLSADPGKARSLNLTSKALRLLKQAAIEDTAETSSDGIALLGRIAAGSPIEAIENVERISLQSEFGSDEETFALKVQGDSMIGDGIFDGDFVVCKKSQNAQNGKIVAAVVDNENATVKRFFRESNRIRLEPSNPAYEPIYTQNCTIAGIVVGLMRKI
ncbi:MAG: LexA repressor [Planctomycetes bacterium ADurb.Bin401]|jgi:repressor LexA|nr:MAG: LexA repressor [Planctomycetes bacterium ADurb.Bin401]